jgi:hypothetical protein
MLAFHQMPRRTFCLRLPADLHVRLRAIAAVEGISANALACRGLEAWVGALERRPPKRQPAAEPEAAEEA